MFTRERSKYKNNYALGIRPSKFREFSYKNSVEDYVDNNELASDLIILIMPIICVDKATENLNDDEEEIVINGEIRKDVLFTEV